MTKTTLVHDAFIVKFAAGTTVLINVHCPITDPAAEGTAVTTAGTDVGGLDVGGLNVGTVVGTAVVGTAVTGPPASGTQRSPCPPAWQVQIADPALELRLQMLLGTVSGA